MRSPAGHQLWPTRDRAAAALYACIDSCGKHWSVAAHDQQRGSLWDRMTCRRHSTDTNKGQSGRLLSRCEQHCTSDHDHHSCEREEHRHDDPFMFVVAPSRRLGPPREESEWTMPLGNITEAQTTLKALLFTITRRKTVIRHDGANVMGATSGDVAPAPVEV